ncbi:MAG: anthranilate synthase component I family protein [Lachnospiraceae bacterium]|jgi:anthranilate synthase component 1|nr:anthranilate synthase component I family protein [Lachnospiraceae bacterium]MEE3461983.1 anthranilate synthase component I family protein [Lachnospiraceae bacterium]
MIRPSLEEVKEIIDSEKKFGRACRVIPVSREILSDFITPVTALKKLKNVSDHVYMLESAYQQETWGRYTFLGYDPSLLVSCRKRKLDIEYLSEGKAFHVETEKPASYIRNILNDYRSPKIGYLPSFTGGLVGYFSYDYMQYAEPTLRLDAEDTEHFNDVDLMLFDKVICFDNYRQKIILIANMRVEEEKGIEGLVKTAERNGDKWAADTAGNADRAAAEAASENTDRSSAAAASGNASDDKTAAGFTNILAEYDKACASLVRMENILKDGEEIEDEPGKLESEIKPFFSEKEYCDMVDRAKKYIYEGDIFQIVLSNRLEAKYSGSLINCYRNLRALNPSPYMFYFSGTDVEVAGASPETLAKLEDGVLHTFPLAGTRPRGKTPEEDRQVEKELLADEKELAEHNMLVDLGRNDIGRLSKFGTVRVEKYHEIERFSHVMHIGSTVRGEIRDDLDALDAVDSILPAGTLSGAPKLRACQLINDLENNKRGIYGGAIGYIDFTGNLDTCIAIRIAYKKNGKVFIRSGAGIVADSVPENEYRECLNKAKAVVTALEEDVP